MIVYNNALKLCITIIYYYKNKKFSSMRTFLIVFERGNLSQRGLFVILFAYFRVKKNLELPRELLFIVMKNADVSVKESCKKSTANEGTTYEASVVTAEFGSVKRMFRVCARARVIRTL